MSCLFVFSCVSFFFLFFYSFISVQINTENQHAIVVQLEQDLSKVKRRSWVKAIADRDGAPGISVDRAGERSSAPPTPTSQPVLCFSRVEPWLQVPPSGHSCWNSSWMILSSLLLACKSTYHDQSDVLDHLVVRTNVFDDLDRDSSPSPPLTTSPPPTSSPATPPELLSLERVKPVRSFFLNLRNINIFFEKRNDR